MATSLDVPDHIRIVPSLGFNYTQLLRTYGPNNAIKPNLLLSAVVFSNNGGSTGFIGASATMTGVDSLGNAAGASDVVNLGSGAVQPGAAVPFEFIPLPTTGIILSGATSNWDGILVDPTQASNYYFFP